MTLEGYLKERYTAGTAKRYQRDILTYLEAVGRQQAETARYGDIMEYMGQLRKKYGNPATINTALHGIKKYYNWLNHTGKRKDHPCRSLKIRDNRRKDIQLQDLFSPQELELLMDRKERYKVLKIRNQIVTSLLIYQGLTTGEICSTTLNDIDLDKGTVYIKPGSKTNRRTLKMKPIQIMLFYKYIHEVRPELIRVETDKLILTKTGTAETGDGINYLVETFKPLFPDRNLNPKTIRQSVITNKLKQGKDLRVVQVFAGHKYPSATERYRQNDVEELKKAVQKYHPLK